jgi:hypothetical protein
MIPFTVDEMSRIGKSIMKKWIGHCLTRGKGVMTTKRFRISFWVNKNV